LIAESIARVLTSFQGLLVVDNAYAPFANENAIPLLALYANLVIVRTLSKAYALATPEARQGRTSLPLVHDSIALRIGQTLRTHVRVY